MNESEYVVKDCIEKLYDFRSKIPANLAVEKVKEIWQINIPKEEIPKIAEFKQGIIKRKVVIAEDCIEWLLFKPWVKFVGISGSVASEFAREDDDIDLFIVVKNDTAWIYRLYVYFRNIFKHRVRSKKKEDNEINVKDKLCINFITEQRALHFENDVFNLNEILYIKPIYNRNFLRLIFLSNPWLKDAYRVSDKYLDVDRLKVGDIKELTKRNYLLFIFNFIAFLGQLLFMIVTRHQPDLKRLSEGFKEGRIEFYPKEFKKSKMGKFRED